MKTVRKLLLWAMLSAVLVMTLTAHICSLEYTRDSLIAELDQADEFIKSFYSTRSTSFPYFIGKTWQFGIILNKQWTDNSLGVIKTTALTIRTRDAQSIQYDFGLLSFGSVENWNRLKVGDLVAFGDLKASNQPLVSEIAVVMSNTETGFTKVLHYHNKIP